MELEMERLAFDPSSLENGLEVVEFWLVRKENEMMVSGASAEEMILEESQGSEIEGLTINLLDFGEGIEMKREMLGEMIDGVIEIVTISSMMIGIDVVVTEI